MRLPLLALVVATMAVPSLAAAQTPPVVVVGPPPASSGPPPSVTPTVPPGYQIEGELGGIHFRAQVTTPAPPPAAVVAPAPAAPPPAPIVVPAPAPVMTVQAPPPVAPTYPTYAYGAPQAAPVRDRAPRLDDEGMDFGGRLGFELLGAGLGFGLATGLGYLVDSENHDDGLFAATILTATAGLVPAGLSLFGGGIAGGRGRYGGAMLGEMIGGGLSAMIVLASGAQLDDPWELIGIIAGPAILGAILGFEAQHGLRSAQRQRVLEREGVELSSLSIAPAAQGTGATVGIAGTF